MNIDYEKLELHLQAELSPKRYAHVLGCREEIERLAQRWGADLEMSKAAAMLHDITKELDSAAQLKKCAEFGIIPNDAENAAPTLLHAATAAEIARREYSQPPEVVDAIRYHSTGRAGMSLLEKLLYVADFIEPTRIFDHSEMTRLAYSDIDAAVIHGLVWTIKEVLDKEALLHTDTVEAYNDLLGGKTDR